MASRLRLLLAALLALFVLGVAAAPAHAAGADQIDSFTIAYTVRPDGVLEVQETIVLRFGSSSGRHGLERFWVIREPYDDRQDAVYRIEQIDVSSPSGAATQWSRTDSNASDGRLAVMRIRIGDPAVTITQPTATYVLRYHVFGAMRSHQGFDSLYWDATGDRFPLVKNAAINVVVPGGALDVFCSAAEPGVRADCDRARIRPDKSAEFAHKTLQPGQILTVEVMIAAGVVADNKPHLEERADAAAERFAQGLMIGSGVAAGIIPLIGWWYYRRNGTDKRFVGLPPGVLPIRGQVPREVPDKDVEIPVSFAPPRLPLAVAGLLLDGTTQVRHTTATLVGLAVSGAIKLRSGPDPEARLIDPRKVPDKPSDLLLDSIFDSGQTSVALDVQGALSEGHDDIVKYVARQADQGKWFVRRSPRKAAGSVTGGLAAASFVGFWSLGSAVLMVIPVAVSLIATVAVVSAKLTRGQRSGVGRALTDQVEGSGRIWQPLKPTSFGSRRERTSSPSTFPGLCSSIWQIAGQRSVPNWWSRAGSTPGPPPGTTGTPGTSATWADRWTGSTPPSPRPPSMPRPSPAGRASAVAAASVAAAVAAAARPAAAEAVVAAAPGERAPGTAVPRPG
ncbi:MAG: DUF2207 domain-containing protein [Micropruina sp.]|nr:DUF2207 domain-containing protein [Micropruina sp.]